MAEDKNPQEGQGAATHEVKGGSDNKQFPLIPDGNIASYTNLYRFVEAVNDLMFNGATAKRLYSDPATADDMKCFMPGNTLHLSDLVNVLEKHQNLFNFSKRMTKDDFVALYNYGQKIAEPGRQVPSLEDVDEAVKYYEDKKLTATVEAEKKYEETTKSYDEAKKVRKREGRRVFGHLLGTMGAGLLSLAVPATVFAGLVSLVTVPAVSLGWMTGGGIAIFVAGVIAVKYVLPKCFKLFGKAIEKLKEARKSRKEARKNEKDLDKQRKAARAEYSACHTQEVIDKNLSEVTATRYPGKGRQTEAAAENSDPVLNPSGYENVADARARQTAQTQAAQTKATHDERNAAESEFSEDELSLFNKFESTPFMLEDENANLQSFIDANKGTPGFNADTFADRYHAYKASQTNEDEREDGSDSEGGAPATEEPADETSAEPTETPVVPVAAEPTVEVEESADETSVEPTETPVAPAVEVEEPADETSVEPTETPVAPAAAEPTAESEESADETSAELAETPVAEPTAESEEPAAVQTTEETPDVAAEDAEPTIAPVVEQMRPQTQTEDVSPAGGNGGDNGNGGNDNNNDEPENADDGNGNGGNNGGDNGGSGDTVEEVEADNQAPVKETVKKPKHDCPFLAIQCFDAIEGEPTEEQINAIYERTGYRSLEAAKAKYAKKRKISVDEINLDPAQGKQPNRPWLAKTISEVVGKEGLSDSYETRTGYTDPDLARQAYAKQRFGKINKQVLTELGTSSWSEFTSKSPEETEELWENLDEKQKTNLYQVLEDLSAEDAEKLLKNLPESLVKQVRARAVLVENQPQRRAQNDASLGTVLGDINSAALTAEFRAYASTEQGKGKISRLESQIDAIMQRTDATPEQNKEDAEKLVRRFYNTTVQPSKGEEKIVLMNDKPEEMLILFDRYDKYLASQGRTWKGDDQLDSFIDFMTVSQGQDKAFAERLYGFYKGQKQDKEAAKTENKGPEASEPVKEAAPVETQAAPVEETTPAQTSEESTTETQAEEVATKKLVTDKEKRVYERFAAAMATKVDDGQDKEQLFAGFASRNGIETSRAREIYAEISKKQTAEPEQQVDQTPEVSVAPTEEQPTQVEKVAEEQPTQVEAPADEAPVAQEQAAKEQPAPVEEEVAKEQPAPVEEQPTQVEAPVVEEQPAEAPVVDQPTQTTEQPDVRQTQSQPVTPTQPTAPAQTNAEDKGPEPGEEE